MSHTELLIEPIPYPGESAASFLLRAAQLNKQSSVNNLFGKDKLNFLTKQAPNCDLTDLPRFKYILQLFNMNTEYQQLAFERMGPTSRSARKWNHIEIDDNLFKLYPYSYCPKCLAEQPYFKKLWLLKPIYACPIHSVFLIDHCYQCNTPIDLKSGRISICSSCMHQLKDTSTIHCASIRNIKWFIRLLNHSSNEVFQLFTSYWLALKHFVELDSSISTEQLLEITHEYFVHPQDSVERISKWINKRIYLAHPRVQLLAFLKHRYIFLEYTREIEKKCDKYELTPQSIDFDLTPGDARWILDINPKTLKIWVKKDFLQLGQETYKYLSYSSNTLEKFLLSKANQLDNYPIRPITIPTLYMTRIGIKNIAEKLNINYDSARKLVRTTWVDLNNISIDGSVLKGFSYAKLETFNSKYILASALAKELEVSPTNLVEKLIHLGINPISGPHIDGNPLNIFTRSSTAHLRKSDLDIIEKYKTRTGRSPKSHRVKSQQSSSLLPLKVAAKKLGLSPNKTAVLTQKGILIRDKRNLVNVMINRTSLLSLIDKLKSNDFVEIREAAFQLNCSLNWITKYWCNTGFLTVDDLIYWKLIPREELSEVLKLKEIYMTGTEASKLLGMRHSHITNLQKQGLIHPYYLGKTDLKIRLFKRDDVIRIKNENS